MPGRPHGPVALVLRALGLGDLCTGVPALRALRRSHPEHHVVLAAPAWQASIALTLGIDEVVDTTGLEGIPARFDGAELMVNLHGSGPQSTRLLLERRPGTLWAYAHPMLPETTGGPRWRDDEHDRDRWCRLLQEHGVPADPLDLLLPVPARPPLVDPGTVVVHPGAASPSRRWPEDRFAAVVAHLLRTGRAVALTGSDREAARCARIAALAARASGSRPLDLAGRTDLESLVATVAAADGVICGDTGVAHLATALRTPSVVLFGPTSPAEWGPPPSRRHRVLWTGRHGDPHGPTLDPGLAAIRVADVIDAWEALADDPAVDERHAWAR